MNTTTITNMQTTNKNSHNTS